MHCRQCKTKCVLHLVLHSSALTFYTSCLFHSWQPQVLPWQQSTPPPPSRNSCEISAHIILENHHFVIKIHSSIVAVVSGEKTSRTSKWDSWSQLKCNLSNPVICRSKGFPLSASAPYRFCCSPAWASVCVWMCVEMRVCLLAWVWSTNTI